MNQPHPPPTNRIHKRGEKCGLIARMQDLTPKKRMQDLTPKKRLFVNEIGYIGFLADRYIYDAGGMVTKDILDIRRRRRREIDMAETIERLEPDYVVVMSRQSRRFCKGSFATWFSERYELVHVAEPYQTFRKRDRAADGTIS